MGIDHEAADSGGDTGTWHDKGAHQVSSVVKAYRELVRDMMQLLYRVLGERYTAHVKLRKLNRCFIDMGGGLHPTCVPQLATVRLLGV